MEKRLMEQGAPVQPEGGKHSAGWMDQCFSWMEDSRGEGEVRQAGNLRDLQHDEH